MSRRIILGTVFDDSLVDGVGRLFPIDLDVVLRSNLLLQANSGGGKSWALRRMLEQSFKQVQQIIIDPEGEFSTLRSKYDFVLVAKGGDTPVAVSSAPLLARRLLELGASAVVDLFEISKMDRPVWVAAFVEALVDAPKNLWHDLLVYVDEAHELAPEPGHGVRESAGEVRSRRALIDLASKGRKRGFGVVAATQRLGKLSKDFAAELKNVLVGQTFIDIDRERAAACLGISKAGKNAFFQHARNMAPGTFFALGRALSLESTFIKVGNVITEHPEAGRRQSAAPPPTRKILHLLPQLADLPKEAEEEGKTVDELRAKVRELTTKLATAKGDTDALLSGNPSRWKTKIPATVVVKEKPVEKSVVKPDDVARLTRICDKLGTTEAVFAEAFAAHRTKLVEVVAAQEEKFAQVLEAQRDRLAQGQQAVILALTGLRAAVEGAGGGGQRSAAPTPSSSRPFRSATLPSTAAAVEVSKIATSSLYGKLGRLDTPPRTIKHVKYDTKGWTEMEEELYQKFKGRLVSELRQEAPQILRLVATAPELEVEVHREVVKADGKTVLGRVAKLLHGGWFDKYETAADTARQVNSTGGSVDRRTVLNAIDELVSMGFLLKTSNGYKAVPDMKVNVKETR